LITYLGFAIHEEAEQVGGTRSENTWTGSQFSGMIHVHRSSLLDPHRDSDIVQFVKFYHICSAVLRYDRQRPIWQALGSKGTCPLLFDSTNNVGLGGWVLRTCLAGNKTRRDILIPIFMSRAVGGGCWLQTAMYLRRSLVHGTKRH